MLEEQLQLLLTRVRAPPLQDKCGAVQKSVEWRRFKNSLMKQYHLKGAPAAAKLVADPQ